MKVILIDKDFKIENEDKYCVCLGIFDGVHLGHRKLIEKTVELAKENNLKSAVLTFAKPFEENKIYPLEENLRIMDSMGIDTVFTIDFNEEFKNYSPKHFVLKYLIEYIKAAFVVCGYNFRFGKDRTGDIKSLKEYGENYYSLTVIPEVDIMGETVSSTRIKELLKEGNVEKANYFLGACYNISGAVCQGNKMGRTINFPTVNIPVDKALSLLKPGVYSSKVMIGDVMYPAISNVGTAPTVRDGKQIILETFIMDYEGDLYNRILNIYLLGFIREEKKFNNIEELKSEIKLNIETAKIQLEGNKFI